MATSKWLWWFIQLGVCSIAHEDTLINSKHALGLHFWSTLLQPLLGITIVMCSYFYTVIRREPDELPSSLEDKGVNRYICRVMYKGNCHPSTVVLGWQKKPLHRCLRSYNVHWWSILTPTLMTEEEYRISCFITGAGVYCWLEWLMWPYHSCDSRAAPWLSGSSSQLAGGEIPGIYCQLLKLKKLICLWHRISSYQIKPCRFGVAVFIKQTNKHANKQESTDFCCSRNQLNFWSVQSMSSVIIFPRNLTRT